MSLIPSSIDFVCETLKIHKPSRPEPVYTFFPIKSPFKRQEDDGFDLGEDNIIKELYIEDGALRFEISAILRPGRFLGNHYVAFSIPNRTFIVTLDRVTEGIRAARKTKKAARALKHTTDRRNRPESFHMDKLDPHLDRLETKQQRSSNKSSRKPRIRSFFSRFVDGYLQAERDDEKRERLTSAIRDFFGRQASS
jgi:hypothetical protein